LAAVCIRVVAAVVTHSGMSCPTDGIVRAPQPEEGSL
jgi:hypothetical protein